MSHTALRLAALAAVGFVGLTLATGDAEARPGGGGRGPGLSAGMGRVGPGIGLRPIVGRPIVGRPIVGRPIAHPIRPVRPIVCVRAPCGPFPHHHHRWRGHRYHFVGGVVQPACGVVWLRRFDPATGLAYRVRSYTCQYGYNGY
jgi:hypothetical protein